MYNNYNDALTFYKIILFLDIFCIDFNIYRQVSFSCFCLSFTVIPKSDIRRAQFKGSKSMPAVDASSPEPIVSSTKETEEIPVAIEMSSTGRPAETTNLHLKYLLQVTDSELQNMSREVPSSQTISMGVPSGGKPMTNTQLVLAPVTTSQPSENFIFQEIIKMPVSEKGVEKYHVKSDSLEQQGKLSYRWL